MSFKCAKGMVTPILGAYGVRPACCPVVGGFKGLSFFWHFHRTPTGTVQGTLASTLSSIVGTDQSGLLADACALGHVDAVRDLLAKGVSVNGRLVRGHGGGLGVGLAACGLRHWQKPQHPTTRHDPHTLPGCLPGCLTCLYCSDGWVVWVREGGGCTSLRACKQARNWKGTARFGDFPVAAACVVMPTGTCCVCARTPEPARVLPQPDGATPLFMASQANHLEIVRLLLEQGAEAGAARVSVVCLCFATHLWTHTGKRWTYGKAFLQRKGDFCPGHHFLLESPPRVRMMT
jgi:hypothetical protein